MSPKRIVYTHVKNPTNYMIYNLSTLEINTVLSFLGDSWDDFQSEIPHQKKAQLRTHQCERCDSKSSRPAMTNRFSVKGDDFGRIMIVIKIIILLIIVIVIVIIIVNIIVYNSR